MGRPSLACNICNRQLPLSRSWLIIHDRRFCKEHYRQYKVRQRDGVVTDELSSLWRDSLDNWRDRPIELDHEVGKKPFSTVLFFQQRFQDWLLFARHYIVRNGHKTLAGVIVSNLFSELRRNKHRAVLTSSTSFKTRKRKKSQSMYLHRMGDFLAVNTQTGAMRRFVDVSEEVVLDDLQGIRSAPYQAEIAHLWGNPDPTGIQERFSQQYRAENHRILIPELTRLAAFPTYGLIGNPLELVLTFSISITGDVWHGITNIGFFFSNDPNDQPHISLEIHSSDPHERHILYTPEHAIKALFWRYQEDQALFDPPTIWEGEIAIADTLFSGTVHTWSQPRQICQFHFKGEKTLLSGDACNITQNDLLTLLQMAQPITQQDDVLAQYQREADADHQRLFTLK